MQFERTKHKLIVNDCVKCETKFLTKTTFFILMRLLPLDIPCAPSFHLTLAFLHEFSLLPYHNEIDGNCTAVWRCVITQSSHTAEFSFHPKLCCCFHLLCSCVLLCMMWVWCMLLCECMVIQNETRAKRSVFFSSHHLGWSFVEKEQHLSWFYPGKYGNFALYFVYA